MGEGQRVPTLNTKLRIERALELLQTLPYRKAISQMMEEQSVCRRHATRWVSAARNIILAETKKERDFHVCDSYQTYRSIIDSATATNFEKLKAQHLLDQLLGLQAPFRVAPTNPQGDQSWQPQTADDLRGKLIARLVVPSRQ